MIDQSRTRHPSAERRKLAVRRLMEILERCGGTFEVNDQLCAEVVELVIASDCFGNTLEPR